MRPWVPSERFEVSTPKGMTRSVEGIVLAAVDGFRVSALPRQSFRGFLVSFVTYLDLFENIIPRMNMNSTSSSSNAVLYHTPTSSVTFIG